MFYCTAKLLITESPRDQKKFGLREVFHYQKFKGPKLWDILHPLLLNLERRLQLVGEKFIKSCKQNKQLWLLLFELLPIFIFRHVCCSLNPNRHPFFLLVRYKLLILGSEFSSWVLIQFFKTSIGVLRPLRRRSSWK